LSVARETLAVSFYSDGSRLAGTLYPPTTPALDGPAPAVVVAAGWGGTKDRGLVQFATRFAAAGFTALAFDYRGYGESEGAKNRLFPTEQAADIRAAVVFLGRQQGVDPGRVTVLGVLTSAAAALQAASEDAGIHAVVGFFPFGNGETWMQAQRRPSGWKEFLKRIEDDRVQRAVDGTTTIVDPNEILIRDAEGIEREEKSRAGSPARRAWKLGLDSADAILGFKPEDHLHRISPRAVMLVAVREDTLMPYPEVERLFAKLDEPKRLLTIDGIRHHDIYEATRLDGVINEVTSFLEKVPR
jgi:fermentation-respiration switch protein FrsA (DUF1100 family)